MKKNNNKVLDFDTNEFKTCFEIMGFLVFFKNQYLIEIIVNLNFF